MVDRRTAGLCGARRLCRVWSAALALVLCVGAPARRRVLQQPPPLVSKDRRCGTVTRVLTVRRERYGNGNGRRTNGCTLRFFRFLLLLVSRLDSMNVDLGEAHVSDHHCRTFPRDGAWSYIERQMKAAQDSEDADQPKKTTSRFGRIFNRVRTQAQLAGGKKS